MSTFGTVMGVIAIMFTPVPTFAGPGGNETEILATHVDTTVSLMGWDVVRLEDSDGDGHPNFAVGAFRKGDGEVTIWSAVPSQPVLVSTLTAPPGSKDFGRSLSATMDRDGDGYGDLIIGATPGSNVVGQIFVFSTAPNPTPSSAALLTISHSTSITDWFGFDVASIDDVDGDGVDDILAGHPQGTGNTPPTGLPGYAEIYSGANGAVLQTWTGPYPDSKFGARVFAVSDLDGDGLRDVAIFQASASFGFALEIQFFSSVTGADLGVIPSPGSYFGLLGDLDGDGHEEVAIGGTSGLGAFPLTVLSGATLAPLGQAPTSGLLGFGQRMGPAGDVDRDGHPDFYVSGLCNGLGVGEVQVFSGLDFKLIDSAKSPTTNTYFGRGAAHVGDIDGDGRQELVVGNPASPGEPLCSSSQNGRFHVISFFDDALWVFPETLSVGLAQKQVITLDLSTAFAGNYYLVLTSSATSNLFTLGPGVLLPLALDAFLVYTYSNPNGPILMNSFGLIDGNGQATITLDSANIPPGIITSPVDLYHAALVIAPSGQILRSTNPAHLALIP